MYPLQIEMLVHARLAELSRASNQQANRRSSLRIILESRRARARSMAG